MSNKTIYVTDTDEAIFEKAKGIAGEGLFWGYLKSAKGVCPSSSTGSRSSERNIC